jgi:long-chain acyl-CoA synthetase
LDYCQQPLPDPKIPGSIGKPAAGIRLRLADPQGNIVPAGETGEIQIKGKAVSPGYWRDPEATSRSFINGWFRTGDLAYRDAQGYYYLTGRTAEIATLIESRLEKIASLQDEHYLVT